MSKLRKRSVDLVVTSPPYNLGICYGKYFDRGKRDDYLRWCVQWATELHRVLKPDGSFFLNLGASPSNPMLPHELVFQLRDLFFLQNTIHWIKAISIEDDEGAIVSRGHFKPISSRRFLNDCHEYIFHLHAGGPNAHRSARAWCSLRGQEQYRPLESHARPRSALSR